MSLPPLVEPADELTPDEVRRYSRHLIIPDVRMDGQKRLKNAKVLAVGAGGLGSPTLMYLAAAGVGTLGIIDFDVVDESNLQRQVIHGQSDVGRSKAESARDSIKEINPNVEVVLHEERLDSSNAMEIFAPYDLIVDGTDNFATRYLVNDACVLLGKPYVWGSIFRFDGQASVFWAEHGPCYRCLYPEPPPPGMVPSCAEGGVLGVLCALDRLDPDHRGDQGAHRDRRAAGRPADDLRRPGDAVPHGEGPEGPGVPDLRQEPDHHRADRLRGVLRRGLRRGRAGRRRTRPSPRPSSRTCSTAGEEFLLVDVREPAEWDIVRIPGAVLIPKGDLPQRLSELPQDKPVVLHCKTGVRSAEALALLKNAGFTSAMHVQGGVTAWATQVDKTLPTY